MLDPEILWPWALFNFLDVNQLGRPKWDTCAHNDASVEMGDHLACEFLLRFSEYVK